MPNQRSPALPTVSVPMTATLVLRAEDCAELPGLASDPVRLAITSLVLTDSPRLAGENRAHTRVLASVRGPLPPIVVDRATRRVLDGLHRVQAAKLRGEQTIDALFFDGDAQAAFVYAVKANLADGLPLSLADRRAAAKRMLAQCPQWSDRALAAAAGLSPATVGGIRHRSAGVTVSIKQRVGRDGRVRPVDFAEGRRRAANVIAERPDASLREVAEAAGVSVATARDVRRRLHARQDPVPHRRGAAASRVEPGPVPSVPSPAPGTAEAAREASVPATLSLPAPVAPGREVASILRDLCRDPSLRYTQAGRDLIRWLGARSIVDGDWNQVVHVVPPHCAYPIAELAAAYATAWGDLAEVLLARARAASGGA